MIQAGTHSARLRGSSFPSVPPPTVVSHVPVSPSTPHPPSEPDSNAPLSPSYPSTPSPTPPTPISSPATPSPTPPEPAELVPVPLPPPPTAFYPPPSFPPFDPPPPHELAANDPGCQTTMNSGCAVVDVPLFNALCHSGDFCMADSSQYEPCPIWRAGLAKSNSYLVHSTESRAPSRPPSPVRLLGAFTSRTTRTCRARTQTSRGSLQRGSSS